MEYIKKKSRAAIYLWASVSIMIFAATELLGPIYDPAQSPVLHAIILAIYGFVNDGYIGLSVSLSITVFFMDYVDKEYFCTDFFTKSMYTAYIIQLSFPILAAAKCWVLLLLQQTMYYR
jgi:hypothetical protein